MKSLSKDIINELATQGWKDTGGNDTSFLILGKPGKVIKGFADNYDKPNYSIVIYSYNAEEEMRE